MPQTESAATMDRVLDWLCKASAAIGGTMLIGIALMTLYSVIGRNIFDKPIQGDVELAQLASAVCVASFLPYCQWRKANIIVDFFTTGTSAKTQSRLDGVGALLLAIAIGLSCWRTAVGVTTIKASGETSMLMGFPVWIAYAGMVPGLALTCVVALYMSWRSLTGRDMQPDEVVGEA
jgi:TRAP-type C4-dicarboxylate transport system permease small subunit